jgi:dimethylaniline monooxygenase (N-oxide forming)
MKIAVIGAGCSGLVTLKYLLDSFPSDDVICFEKSFSIRGCWGNQRPDFISTSTKYTTQFSCFRKWTSDVSPEKNFSEFYRGSEFGDYLEDFAKQFNLRKNIHLGVELKYLEWKNNHWSLHLNESGKEKTQKFDAVFLCTGLVNQKVPFNSASIPMTDNPEGIRNKTVIVVGGGESAADVANYLAKSEHNNKVYLSLRSGIRVSPR